MNHLRKTLWALTLAAILAVTLAVSVSADGEARVIQKGQCGDNVYWLLYDDGTLGISGTGDMWDYTNTHGSKPAPWAEYKTSLTALVVDSGVTRIGDNAFNLNSYSLFGGNISLPDGLRSIGDSAFYGCCFIDYSAPEGTALVLPSGLVTIGRAAFQSATIYGGLVLPSGLNAIEDEAFYNSSIRGTVVIPASVRTIGAGPFSSCTFLESIEVEAGNPSYCSIDGVLWSKDGTRLIQYPCYKRVTDPELPSTVRVIGAYAFEGSSVRGTLRLPDGVEEIGEAAFQGASLSEIVVPASVTRILDRAFRFSNILTDITVLEGNPNYASSDGVLYDHDFKTLIQCPGGKKTVPTISPACESIGERAFISCSQMAGNLLIPASVSYIGTWAFNSCRLLSNVYFYGDAPTVGTNDWGETTDFFGSCASDFTIHYLNGTTGWTTPTWYNYPCEPFDGTVSDVISSGQCGDNVTWTLYDGGSLVLSGTGDMWNYEHEYANPFDHTHHVPWRTMRDQITSITIEDGITSVGDYAFYDCSAMTELSLGKDITRIGTFAFEAATALTGPLELPAGLQSIGDMAFDYCHALSGTLDLPDGLNRIGSSAFSSCTSLEGRLIFPASLTEVGERAFEKCTQFKAVYFRGGCPAGGDHLLDFWKDDPSKDVTIYCPEGDASWDACRSEGTWNGYRLADYGSTHYEEIGRGSIAFRAERSSGTWTPDGTISQREYTEVNLDPKWMSYVMRTPFGIDELRRLNPKLYIGTDDEYIYLATSYAPASHSCTWDDDPASMWYSGCIQVGLSRYGETDPETMLEFGLGLSSVTGNILRCVWSDGYGSGYFPAEDSAVVTEKNGTLTYEMRVPWSALYGEGSETPEGFGLSIVWSVGEDQEYNHLQLASGLTGFGKHTDYFAKVTVDSGSASELIRGDVNGDTRVDSDDAIYLLRHTLNGERYPISQSGDMNGDGTVDSNDAIYLLRHTLNPERYPLKNPGFADLTTYEAAVSAAHALVVSGASGEETALIQTTAYGQITARDKVPEKFALSRLVFSFADNPQDPNGFRITGENHNALEANGFTFGSLGFCTVEDMCAIIRCPTLDGGYVRVIRPGWETYAPDAGETECTHMRSFELPLSNGTDAVRFPTASDAVDALGRNYATTVLNCSFNGTDSVGSIYSYSFEVAVTVTCAFAEDGSVESAFFTYDYTVPEKQTAGAAGVLGLQSR